MKISLKSISVGVALSTLSVAAMAADPIVGTWQTYEDNQPKAQVQISQTGSTFTGKIVAGNTEKAKSEVALKLNPEYLGEVRLSMTVDKDKGTVSVNFRTGSKTAKKALEGNIKSLEEAFSAAGLKLDKFEVSIDDQLA